MRRSKETNNVETTFYWDRGYISAESVNNTFTAKNYIGAQGIFARESGNNTEYMLKNGHGDVTNTITNGTVNQYLDYDPYGNQTMGNTTNPFRYCGEYFDEESGLIYLRNRYYNPEIQRFITEDPAKDGLNWYAYCGNNPVNFVDPLGLIREPGYVNGVWCEDPDAYEFGRYSDTYTILVDLGNRWLNTDSWEERDELHNMANEARRMAREGTPLLYGQDTVMETLHENAKEAAEYQELYYNTIIYIPESNFPTPYEWFVAQTCTNWDYKYNANWQVPYDYYNGYDMSKDNRKNWTPWIYFDGMLISGDKFGNINLGYVGTKMGYGGAMLKNIFTMDKDDGPSVEYGIRLAQYGR